MYCGCIWWYFEMLHHLLLDDQRWKRYQTPASYPLRKPACPRLGLETYLPPSSSYTHLWQTVELSSSTSSEYLQDVARRYKYWLILLKPEIHLYKEECIQLASSQHLRKEHPCSRSFDQRWLSLQYLCPLLAYRRLVARVWCNQKTRAVVPSCWYQQAGSSRLSSSISTTTVCPFQLQKFTQTHWTIVSAEDLAETWLWPWLWVFPNATTLPSSLAHRLTYTDICFLISLETQLKHMKHLNCQPK